MIFSMSLPSVFSSVIGLNIFGMSYEALLGLGIIIDVNILKYDGQYSKSIYALAILIKLLRHELLLMMTLRCLQDSLSGLGVEVLLYLLIKLLNSFTEKGVY